MPKIKRKKISKKQKKIAKKYLTKKNIVKKTGKVLIKKKPKMPFLRKNAIRSKTDVIIKNSSQDTFFTKSFFKAKIKVIGIGGGGGSIVSEIGRSLGKASFVVADTDVRSFKRRAGIKYFLFGQELTHGLGTGLNVDLAKRAAESEKEKISKIFEDQDIVIFIVSLGGGLGSGATQVFAQAMEDFNGISLGIFTLPFRFEGKNRQKIATRALKDLQDKLNVSITIPNERIFKVIDANTSITDAFSIVNRNLVESLESLIDLIYNPGIINIDFADLKAILSGKGNLAYLNTAEASGKDRVQTIVHDILHNPLYQTNNFKAQKVLFNIAGGVNLSMFEVDKISRAIFEKNEKAKIIFGISKDHKLKNKVKTTLLTTGPGFGSQIKKEQDVVKVEQKPVIKNLAAVKGASKSRKAKKEPIKPKVVLQKEKAEKENIPLPVFNKSPVEPIAVKRISTLEVVEEKRAVRRNALEAKKVRETRESEKTEQEKEWEIPAFLRKIKIK